MSAGHSFRLLRGLFAVAALACATPACTFATATSVACPTADAAPRAPTDAAQVRLFVGRAPSEPYVVLGRVAVDYHRGEEPIPLLRSAAAGLGADGVMDVQLTRADGSAMIRGIAIAREPAASAP